MKKLLRKLFYNDATLSPFKFYRKKEGGTWYYVVDETVAGGMEGPWYYWTRDPENHDVIKKETY